MNYFQLFKLPVAYELNIDALAHTYRTLQKQYHPDNFATALEQDKIKAVQKTAQINDAYRTLKDPILRAEYLLKIQSNIDIDEEKNIQDAPFLMQQIELHEALQDAQDFDALDALNDKVQSKQQEWLNQLESHLAEQNIEQVTLYLIRLRFIRRLLVLIEKKEDSLY